MSRIELVIFDFDGTLVDTAPDLIRAANLFLESKGYAALPEARIRDEIGLGLRNLIVSVFPEHQRNPEFNRQLEGEFLAVYEREFLHSPRLLAGAQEFLDRWDGQLAIVSNKRQRFIKPILHHLGLDQRGWAAIIGGDTFANMKPHPEPLMAAMNAAGVEPEQTVIVGDGHPDVAGALAVGCPCIAVDFGYTPVDELMKLGAWKSIGNFAELEPLLRSIT